MANFYYKPLLLTITLAIIEQGSIIYYNVVTWKTITQIDLQFVEHTINIIDKLGKEVKSAEINVLFLIRYLPPRCGIPDSQVLRLVCVRNGWLPFPATDNSFSNLLLAVKFLRLYYAKAGDCVIAIFFTFWNFNIRPLDL